MQVGQACRPVRDAGLADARAAVRLVVAHVPMENRPPGKRPSCPRTQRQLILLAWVLEWQII